MTILDGLRQATHTAHLALETQLGLPQRLTSCDDYIRILARFYGIYMPLETSMRTQPAWPLVGEALAPRLKTALLAKDLQVYGMGLELIARCDALPDVSNEARLLGCAYVLEGATLGGQIILRGLGRLGVDAERGGSFFGSYGRQVGPMWKQFRAVLSERLVRDEQQHDAIAAAQETFLCFAAWFAQCEEVHDHSAA